MIVNLTTNDDKLTTNIVRDLIHNLLLEMTTALRSIEDRCARECVDLQVRPNTFQVIPPSLLRARTGGKDGREPQLVWRRSLPQGVPLRNRREPAVVTLVPKARPPMIDLPPINIRRWTIRRKAAVVTAVAAGQITREEVCRRYQISTEEFLSWQRAYETYGLPGLRSTRLQQYRRSTVARGSGRRR
jgi:transposase-like protein